MSEEKAGLVPRAYEPLPLGSIKPGGWLRDQLRIQACGLTGYLDEFWPDVADSGWMGGEGEGWERGPYWLDGAVALAYTLDDDRLIGKVQRWIDYILEHQQEDGWLGPVQDQAKDRYQPYDPWPGFVVLKAFTQYQEATGDERIIPAMQRYLRRLDALLDEQKLFVWGQIRWAELVLSIHWLYERTEEDWLLGLAQKAHDQGHDWNRHFRFFRVKDRVYRRSANLRTHVVNHAMGIKTPAVWYRQSGDDDDADMPWQAIETLDEYHGQVTGVFTGDEHLAGKMPSQGTELCAVVEYLFSLEMAMAILGDARFGDRAERIAYNALPATFKPDMWAHQYDQQVNQVICTTADDRIYTTNGPDANLYGLEPNYGCCTANMHQGWPKFAAHLWMRTPDGGLAATAYAPSTAEFEFRGVPVTVTLETEYPFDETLTFTFEAPEKVELPLHLRVPAWTKDPWMRMDDGKRLELRSGKFYKLTHEWQGTSTLTMHLPMPAEVETRYNGSASILRGPLVYSLLVEGEWNLVGGEPPHGDWEVLPVGDWNYALALDRENPEDSLSFERRPIKWCVFSPKGAPVVAMVKGRKLPEWGLEHNAAAPPPESPVESEEELESLTLVPYGCTNLRVTEFPTLE